MSALFDLLGIIVKRLFIAAFLLGGLMLGLLIAIKVLIIFAIVRLVRRFRGPRAPEPIGNVFEGEYSVVKSAADRATVLMVERSKASTPIL